MRDRYLTASIATSSNTVYNSGLRKYLGFCRQVNRLPFPVRQSLLELFVASVASSISFSTIRVYLAGIQYFNTVWGYHGKISQMKRLYYVLRGVRRLQGTSMTRVARRPFTVQQLYTFVSFISTRFNSFDYCMIKAVISVAFFALLRSSEYTSQSSQVWDPASHLGIQDVSWCASGDVCLHLKSSKTDPFKSGVDIYLTRLASPLCPVAALGNYLSVRGRGWGPLFLFSDGSFLTRARLSSLIKLCFPSVSLDTHSFRIGGASLAAQSGVPPLLIQKLGRWRSDAFLRYIHFDRHDISEAQNRMAGAL